MISMMSVISASGVRNCEHDQAAVLEAVDHDTVEQILGERGISPAVSTTYKD